MKIYNKQYTLKFEGGYLEIPHHADLQLSEQLTIAAWIKPTADSGTQLTIFSKDYQAYELQVQRDLLVLERGPEYAGTRKINQNEWIHVAATFDASLAQDNLKLYINGELDAAHTVANPLATNEHSLLIGARPDGSLVFKGEIASAALWNEAHSAWQIKQDFGSPIDTANRSLLGYWNMEEGSGTTVRDQSTYGRNATINGVVTWQAVKEPVVVRPPARRQVRDTTAQRVAQLMESPDEDHQENPNTLPPSGRNGEATKLFNRVKAYRSNLVSQKRIEVNGQVQEAKEANAARVRQAHLEAARKMNSTRFDQLWFIYRSRIHWVDRRGEIHPYYVGDVSKTNFTVVAQELWQKTGITVQAGQAVSIRYTGGRWNISPQDRNLTAKGTTRFNGFASYALKGAPAGCLVGRVGGQVFYVGENGQVPDGLTGDLELITNDDVGKAHGNGYPDNSGSIQVEITFIREAVNVEAADLMIDPAAGMIFWGQATAPFSLHAASMDGSNHQKLVDHQSIPVTSVALDEQNRKIYHIMGTGKIMRIDYDGSNHATVLDISGPSKEAYWQLEIDQQGGKMYWTNDFSIWRANLDGSDMEQVIPNHEAPFPIDLALDSETKKLYWVDKELEVVRRANFDGSEPEDIHAAKNPVRGLMLDYVNEDMRDVLKQEVYWAAREEKITARTPGMVGHWQLDEGKGYAFHNDIDPFTDFVLGVKRRSDDLPPNLSHPAFALDMNGSDRVLVPLHHTNRLSDNSFTIEFWVKPRPYDAALDQPMMAGTHHADNKCIHLVLRDQKAYLGFYGHDITGKTNILANRWTHLAFTYHKERREMAIYVNGVLDGMGENKDPLAMDEDALVWLGAYRDKRWNGLLADVRISHQTLSQAAILETMKEHKPADLMGDLDTGPNWNQQDSPPTLIPLQATLGFNGTSQYTGLSTAERLRLNEGSFTAEAWVRMGEKTGDQPMAIVGSQATTSDHGLLMGLNKGKPIFRLPAGNLEGSVALTKGTWNHLAWRYNALTQRRTIFLNGEPHAESGGAVHFPVEAGQPLPDVWEVKSIAGGPQLSTDPGYLHYKASPLIGANLCLKASIKQAFPGKSGTQVRFRVRGHAMGGNEVKFSLPGNVILRFTNNGMEANYQWWNGGFQTLGPSKVRPDGKWHEIIMQFNETHIELFEDGRKVFTWTKEMTATIEPCFHVQVLDNGSQLSFDLDDIAVYPHTMREADEPSALDLKGPVGLGRAQGQNLFAGDLSQLRIWNVARTHADIAANYRHYRESFAFRGPVDGSDAPEHLFEIPAEGGLNLVSQFQTAYEQRLLAYRKRKQNQAIAAEQVQTAHDDKERKISAKNAELTRTEQETSAQITAKRSQHENERTANRNRLGQAENNKTSQIAHARTQAQQRRATAEQQAEDTRNRANADATNMKNRARSERDRARAERDNNRR